MSDEYDDIAKPMGWQTKDDWVASGKDPDDHRSSEDFVKRAENDAALAIKTNRTLAEKAGKLAETVEEQQKTLIAVTERMEKAHEAKIRELEAQIEKAAETGDLSAHKEGMKELKAAQAETIPTVPKVDPVQTAAEAFVARVPQFETDEEVKKEAIALERYYGAKENDPENVFAEVESALRTKFPEKFGEKPEIPKPPTTVTPAGRPQKKGKMTFNSIPSEDKAEYQKVAAMFKGQGKEYTKEQFMKTYVEELGNE